MNAGGHFGDRLAAAVERTGTPLCVGLDPMAERLPGELRREEPAEAYERFCRGIVDAVADVAVAVKLQSAFFEALGSPGVAVFERVCDHARDAGLLVLADVKRGDIATTAEAYAEAFLGPRGGGMAASAGGRAAGARPEDPAAVGGRRPPLADAMTVSAYMGGDSVEPFLETCRAHGRGIFCLVKTSNPGGADVQDVELAGGRPLWEHVAGLVDGWAGDLVGESGLSSVGAVVGATHAGAVETARRLMPRSVLLLLGVGAQGATTADAAAAFATHPAGGLVSISRAIIYAHEQAAGDWQAAAAGAASRFAAELRVAVEA